jgi:8-oxo-dGTP pyrophosphatase MutT (NUDIX family)
MPRDTIDYLLYQPGGQPVSPEADVPLTFAVIVARHGDQYVIMYNGERHQWELPGGGLEPCERIEDCAARELFEETGQVAWTMQFLGLFKVHHHTDGHDEYGALYTAEIEAMQPFTPNEESARILLWDGAAPLDDRMGGMSRWLLGLWKTG